MELLEARIVAQKEDLDRVLEHNRVLASQPIPQRSPVPLFMSDDEEDIRYQQELGQLSIAEAEDMLRELDFENEHIILEDGSSI
jgi:hypothetical protein